jgi:hypothetical protein
MAGIPEGGRSGTRSELSRSAHHQPAPPEVPRPPSPPQKASSPDEAPCPAFVESQMCRWAAGVVALAAALSVAEVRPLKACARACGFATESCCCAVRRHAWPLDNNSIHVHTCIHTHTHTLSHA